MITEGISNRTLQLLKPGEAIPGDPSAPGDQQTKPESKLVSDQTTSKPLDPLKPQDEIQISERKPAPEDKTLVEQKKDSEVKDKVLKEAEALVKEMVKNLNKKFDRSSLHLRFGQDEDSGLDYFQLYNRKNGDIIKQYPSDEMLEMVAHLQDMTGVIFNEKA